MIKNIIFDMDGVLRIVKEEPIAKILSPSLLSRCSADEQEMTVKQFYGKHLLTSPCLKLWDTNKISQEGLAEQVCADGKVNHEVLMKLLEFRLVYKNNVFYKPVFKLIRKLKRKGYKIYVLSNMGKELADLLKIWVGKNFNDMIFSCDTGMAKPELDIYKMALIKWNANPEESIFIDDNPINLPPFKSLGGHTFLFDRFNVKASVSALKEEIYKS